MIKASAVSLKEIKNTLKLLCAIILTRISIFLCFSKSVFKRHEIYLLTGLCLFTCVSSSFCFKNSSVLNAWAESFLDADAIIKNNYSHYTIQSSPTEFNSADQLNDAINDLKDIHQATYDSMHFLSPVGSDNEISIGTPLKLSMNDETTAIDGVSCGVANYGNFNNETVGAKWFAGCNIESLFKDSEHLVWTLFPFEGKDASSFISTALADQLIKSDVNDSFDSYESLLGAQLSYELDGKIFQFSINNIYSSTSYLGPAVCLQFDNPIITDCPSLFTNRDLSYFFSFTENVISLRENIYQLAEPKFSDFKFQTYFQNKSGEKILSEDIVPDIIKTLYKDYYQPINSDNIIWFLVMITCFALTAFAGIAIGLKSDSIMIWNACGLALLFSGGFIVIFGIVFASLGQGLLSFQICNPVTGALGVLLPLFVCAFLALGTFMRGRLK